MRYSYTLLYRKGKENTVVDALSRMHDQLEISEGTGSVLSEEHGDMAHLEGGLKMVSLWLLVNVFSGIVQWCGL